jgi:hypothetical protein
LLTDLLQDLTRSCQRIVLMTSRCVLAVAMVTTSMAVVACGGVGRHREVDHRSSPDSALPVVEIPAPAKRPCRFQSAFEALAEIDGGSVVCPTWLPDGLRASALTIGSSAQVSSDQISLSGGHWIITVGPAPSASRPGTVIERARLTDGTQIRLRTARRRFVVVSLVHADGGQQVADITLTPSRLSHSEATAAAERLVSSLRVMSSDIIGRRASCQYPAVFAAAALVAGADTAQCPQWLPANVTLDLASAGPYDEYNPVEFHGSVGNGVFPHVVFEWVAHAPPSRPVLSMTLHSGRHVPIYFQPPGTALNSDHLIALISAPPTGPEFWVTLHNSYGSLHATDKVLRRIINSLRLLDALSGRPQR